MRLTLSFIILLVLATVAAGLLWANIPEARAGDPGARMVAALAVPLTIVSFTLLGRIVSKAGTVSGARGEG
jgi:hypothetical protein